MSEPITPIAEVRRRVEDLVLSGVDQPEAIHCVALALHMSVERVVECLEQETHQ